MKLSSIARALPEHRFAQAEIRSALEAAWRDRRDVLRRLPALFEHARVEHRHLVRPLEWYLSPRTFGETNDAWIDGAQDLGGRALARALEASGLAPRDVDAIFTISVTGLASPSLDARLANRMGLRSDVKRVPIFGLGCVGGVAGIARAADYVRAFPDQVAALVSVELCSLTFQRGDGSLANAISAGLFGDGAAAVIVVGERRAERMGLVRAPDVAATRSIFYPGTEDLMGWRISETGFSIVLSPRVPELARARLGGDAAAFLDDCGVDRREIGAWVCHPGGPRVLEAIRDALELSDDDVALSWKTLAETGNLSSTSALLVLEETLRRPPAPGSAALLLALGPAFCSELVLLRF